MRKGLSIGNYSVDDQAIRSIFAECDKNGDGKIDYKEFVDAVTQIWLLTHFYLLPKIVEWLSQQIFQLKKIFCCCQKHLYTYFDILTNE